MARALVVLAIVVPCAGFFAPRVASRLVTPVMVEGTPLGRPHTAESRAKISAANRGKTPWNKGRQHSEETRRLIGERTKLAMRRKKAEKLAAIGLTLEQWEAEQAEKKRSRAAQPRNVSEATRAKISIALKKRWQDPDFRTRRTETLIAANRTRMGGVTHHTEETRRIISEKIKERWRDPQYRRRILASNNGSLNQETREKIAATLRKRWEDPEFRKQMTGKIARAKSEEHRQRISAAIRSKWDDESYRERTLNGIWQRSKELREGASDVSSRPATRRSPAAPSIGPSMPIWQAATKPRKKRATPKPQAVVKKAPEPDVAVVDEETERRNRLRITAPDLWASLYDESDDDDEFL